MQTFRKLPTTSPKRKRRLNQRISSVEDPTIRAVAGPLQTKKDKLFKGYTLSLATHAS